MNKQKAIKEMGLLKGNGWDEYNEGFKDAVYACIGIVEQLPDEPSPPEGCEYCENGIDQETTLFQFLPPHKSNNKDIGDTITFEEINFCPACGRPLKTEEMK